MNTYSIISQSFMRIGEQKYFWLFGTAPPSIIGDGIDSQFSTIVKTHLSFTVSLGLPTKYVVVNTLFLHLTRELIPCICTPPNIKKNGIIQIQRLDIVSV
jgi:hypothetical protein